MTKGTGRRQYACHHEAGHAFARWYFGYRTDRVVVLTTQQVSAGVTILDGHGREIECEGLCEGYDIIGWPYGPVTIPGDPEDEARINCYRAVARDIEMINCHAGFHAEAHYRRVSPSQAMFAGGLVDMSHLQTLLDAWRLTKDESNNLAMLAQMRTSALVRSKKGSSAIKALADALVVRGEVEDSEISAIFRQSYDGQQCQFGAWQARWPPTLAQLKAGHIQDRTL